MNKIKRTLIHNGSTICTISGILLMLTGTVLAVKETGKAIEHIKEADIPEDSSKAEKAVMVVKATWKDYAWAVAAEAAGMSLIFCSHQNQVAQNHRLSNLLYASDIAYRNLQDKLDEKLTKKQVNDIRDSVAEDRTMRDMPKEIKEEQQEISYDGKQWFHDAWTGHFFRSTDELVDRTIAKYNKAVDREHYITQNQLIIDLGENGGKEFEDLGWDMGEEIEIMHKTLMDFNGGVITDIEYTKPHVI